MMYIEHVILILKDLGNEGRDFGTPKANACVAMMPSLIRSASDGLASTGRDIKWIDDLINTLHQVSSDADQPIDPGWASNNDESIVTVGDIADVAMSLTQRNALAEFRDALDHVWEIVNVGLDGNGHVAKYCPAANFEDLIRKMWVSAQDNNARIPPKERP